MAYLECDGGVSSGFCLDHFHHLRHPFMGGPVSRFAALHATAHATFSLRTTHIRVKAYSDEKEWREMSDAALTPR